MELHRPIRALIIDDEPDICELLSITLKRMGLETDTAYSINDGLDKIKQTSYQIGLTDMRLPDGEGFEIIKAIQALPSPFPIAVITAHGNMELAINALKLGAFDFIAKPIELDHLRDIVSNALKLSKPLAISEKPFAENGLLGNSSVIKTLRGSIFKIARSQAPVHITGPSGSGKELVAKLIHESSPRKDGKFVAVNCGAIPHELMESELFGHKKGSFTGAHADKIGLFDAANQGTLFLDEVADLPLPMQVKLLRAIQEKAFRPIGATEEKKCDVRILSATHQSLPQKVLNKEFREDLFYRLNVIELIVPSLAERKEDIPLLANYLLKKIAARSQKSLPQLAEAAIAQLQAYRFPGNVRELENILERAFALSDGKTIDPKDLSFPSSLPNPNNITQKYRPEQMSLDEYLQETEKEAILETLEATQWNKTATAKALGMSFRSLRYRLKKLGLDD